MVTLIDKIRLCFYPSVIVLFSIFFTALAFLFTQNLLIRISAVGLSLYFFHFAIILFMTIPSKIRSVIILVNKNKNQIKIQSFEKYMTAPCGRQVTRITLQKLMRLDLYKSLKKDFPLNLFSIKKNETRIVYYKDGKKVT